MKNLKQVISILLVLTMLLSILPLHVNAADIPAAIQQDSVHKGDGYTIEFQVGNQWGNQYEGAFIITNTGSKTIENWQFTCQYDNEIQNIWNAKIDSYENCYYTIKNAGWNEDILPQQSIRIGFIAAFNSDISVPKDYQIPMDEAVVPEEHYQIDFSISSDWGSGFNGTIKITNTGSIPIEDWKLEFDFNRNIKQFWTANILSANEGHYVIQNAGYNSILDSGQSLSLGFSGDSGAMEPKLENVVLIEQGKIVNLKKDSDNDGLSDGDEDLIGTDKFKADTDGDGLWDGYEVHYLDTDASLFDTDNNGVSDGEEDFDEDGLTNKEEYLLGTIPFSKDTDNDGLLDGDEIKIHFTDPLLEDTDGDGISDGDELKLNLNPLSQYTTEGILDSDILFEQSISEEILNNINENSPYELSINVTAGGLADSVIKVKESNNTEILSDNISVLGKVITFEYPDFELKNATLNFKISPEEINEDNLSMPGETGLEGVQRFQIFRYSEELGILYPVSTSYDTDNNILSIEHCLAGDYCVIDLDDWLYSVGIDLSGETEGNSAKVETLSIDADTRQETADSSQTEEGAAITDADFSAGEKEPVIKDDELPDDYDSVMLQQIMKSGLIDRNELLNSSRTSSVASVNKQIDLTFVIDTSGSMGSKINSCKSYMKSLVQNLYNDNITARVSVLSFDDYENQIKTYKLSSGESWGKNPVEADSLISQVNITNGWRENHIDALEEAMNLTYRGNTTRFAVLLTDEPLTASDNISSYTVTKIAEKLKENNIITSVVCANNDASTFRPIFEGTEGIQISISSNFNYYLELFIKTVMKNSNLYTVVVPNNLTTITLSSVPNRNSTVDTDKDGWTDSREIDWTLIKDDNGLLLLPTLREYLVANGLKDIETFIRLSKEKADIINAIVVLPIYSNPAKTDSDGDGYLDPEDQRPLISDVIVTKLVNNKFLPVVDGSKIHYGGDQGWFQDSDNTIGKEGGCGTVAAANTAAYLAKYNKDLTGLYSYDTITITKEDFKKHMNEMYKYVTPKRIGSQPLGVWPLSHYTKGVVNFAKSREISLDPYLVNKEMNKKNVTDYIKKGLGQNSPVAMLIGWNPKLENVTTYDPTDNSSWSQSYNMHWVTIAEIKEDLITNKTTMKVSSWGGYAYIDVDDYVKGENLYKAIVFFTKK